MAGEAQIQFTIKLLRPSDPTEVGSEALRLARSISQITRDELIQITEPVRAGFKENFETESAAGDPWQVLAKRTQDEREELGFDREHPILVRKGDYKKSWLDVNDPNNALELTEKGRQDPLIGILPETFLAQLGRKDRAARLPERCNCLARSRQIPYQAFRVPGTPVWAFQFHPELDKGDNLERFNRYWEGYAPHMNPEEREQTLAQFRESPDTEKLLSRFTTLVFG